MVLRQETIKKIVDFVYKEPRTIQDIAQFLDINWRTADSYVERIAEESGVLNTKLYRGGTRGALKIVFYVNIEKQHASTIQERFFKQIDLGNKKDDFDFFDIYEQVDETKRNVIKETMQYPKISNGFVSMLRSAEREVFCFSGNASWINLVEDKTRIIDVLRELAKNKVKINIICRVDYASMGNIQKLYEINQDLGAEIITIKHVKQPLRGFIVDDKIARFKDEKAVYKYRTGELKESIEFYYELYDKDWIIWMQKVFWHFFRNAPTGTRRIEEIEKTMISN